MTGDPLAAARSRATTRIVGLISGTSADGISAALVHVADPPGGDAPGRPTARLVAHITTPYLPAVRERVMDLFTRPATTQEIASIHYLLGEVFGEAALAVAKAAGGTIDEVDLIASHGQTVAHVGVPDPRDPLNRAATLQLGEAAVIAERTGRPVVADFRAADVAAGGQGAPLVPYADFVLLGGSRGRVALNLGGISNITVLPPGARRDDVYAFDCGPGNMLIDGLVRRFSEGGEDFDREGARAARGSVHEELLAVLLSHPFIDARPPKTAGHEEFGRPFVDRLLTRWGTLAQDDLVATATAFSAEAVARNIERFVLPHHTIEELIVSGGGADNRTLIRRLERAVGPIRVRRTDEFGIPSQAKEAIAFALLGHASLVGIPGNFPRVTGARHPAVLGKWTWPPQATHPAGA